MNKLDRIMGRKKQEESVWSSICDMMSGLMIVFLFIAVSFMSKVADESIKIKQQQKTVEDVVNTYENTKGNIYNDLYSEFEKDMGRWNMEIDKDATIRFREPDVFFDQGKSEMKNEFKVILDDFFPRYINVIYKNHKDNVRELRIEGHTSTEWKNKNKMDSYFGNMELSQDRTRHVLEYVMGLEEVKSYEDWIIKNITANGMSYSRCIQDKNKNEITTASRRVEFKVITNAEETIDNIVNEYKK